MNCAIDVYEDLTSCRLSIEELIKIINNYDVISFDVFGTLILRPFTSPRVLFSIMESRLGVYKFAKIRVDSEEEARNHNNRIYNNDNVNLEQIYNIVSKKTNLDAQRTSQLEYELELKYCYANKYFIDLISLCIKLNKKLVVCSDMYLDTEQIKGILINSGYTCFCDIFVSSELHKSKKKGDMFILLKEKYHGKKIIHIGDNEVSDIQNARLAGIDAYYYKNVNNIGTKDRINDMSYITSKIYSAILNNHLYSNKTNYDEAYKLGYIYGGIYVLGFVQWVNKFINDRDIDKVLFLSRDGDIYSKMYNLLPEHREWTYFYWSRLAGAKFTALENFYEFCQRMIWHKSRGAYNIKIENLLNFFELYFLFPKLENYNLSSNDILTYNTANAIEKMFYDFKESIIDTFNNDIVATIESVKEAVGDSRRIAIVDVGWAGTGPLILKKIIKNYLDLDCKVYSLLAGYRQPIKNMESLYIMDDSIDSYLFSGGHNKDLLNLHINSGTKKNNLLLELFTLSCTPSFLGYTKNGLLFDWDEYDNYDIIRKIHMGIEDFVSKYIDLFKSDRFLMNISPYDAYLPFNELKNSSHRLDNILSQLVISRGKFYDPENKSTENWYTFLYQDND